MMIHTWVRFLSVGAVAAGLVLPTGLVARDLASASKTKPAVAKPNPAKSASAAAKPKRQLSPELGELRDRVRSVLTEHRQQLLSTRDNSATEILSRCLAFGCDTEVLLDGADGRHINGITALCWNYPCSGFEMLGRSKDHIAARIGYGYQERPGEFLAMLALSRVQPDYPVRLGKTVRKVADVVQAEKLACRADSDMSLALVGLAYYVDEPEWKNDLGETWSIERIVAHELEQPMVGAPEGGLNRLMGLSFTLTHRAKHGKPNNKGDFDRAQKYVADFQRFAFQQQDSDGSWGPHFPARRGSSAEAAVQLRATGHVLEWLALSLPQQRLEDAGMINAVTYLTSLLGSERYQGNASALSTRE
ncbi:MAG: hypothetical protein LLG00_15650, partial [Planctomycetaceae bacterium]|nr:hypothetical protein [Planctomycetaceae bacterium]